MKAQENIYLTADKEKAVGEASPDQAFLLVGKGSEVSPEIAERFGIKNGRLSAKKSAAKKSDKSKRPAANKAK